MTRKEILEIGKAHERNGEIDQAFESYSRAVGLWPQEIGSYYHLSKISFLRGDNTMALEWAERGLLIDPNNIQLLNIRAITLVKAVRYDEAEKAFNRIIDLSPENKESIHNLGRLLLIQKRFAEALAYLRRAAEINPDSAVTFLDLGYALHGLYRYDDSIAAFDRAIELNHNYAEAMSRRGAVLSDAHRFQEAQAQFNKALDICSNQSLMLQKDQAGAEAMVHFNIATLLLSLGNLAAGLEEYEWRWKVPGMTPIRQYPGHQLLKKNENIDSEYPFQGETFFVWPEQGIGDTIHFIRFLEQLAKRDCKIIAEIQPELYRLVTASFDIPNLRFVRAGETTPAFDKHISLLSLPRVLDTTYENLPLFKPYLSAHQNEIGYWRQWFDHIASVKNPEKKKIGIVWAGSPIHPFNKDRSMSLETIEQLVRENKDRFQFFSLQVGAEQSAEIPGVLNLGGMLDDFATTAAVVANLDLVISVDTSIVHLAGALGKPVWTMLFYSPDWRWRMDKYGIGEKTTPWYPSMSLFWQKKPGQWVEVIEEVSEQLKMF